MNFEGLVKNTAPVHSISALNYNAGNRVSLPNSSDSVSLNGTLDRYINKNAIQIMCASNPKIINLLQEKGVPLNINVESFRKNVYNHSVDTRKIALGIYNNLPENLKTESDIRNIADAALLHDLGKVLIPESILTKKTKLSPNEENIMQLHSTLSYELLKNNGVNNSTLNIIKYHHQNPVHTGYPLLDKTENIDINSQIVSLADKYSALREQRSYKKQLNENEALGILSNEINKGVSNDVYNALTNYVYANNQPHSKNTIKLSNYFNIKNATPRQNQDVAFVI